MPAINERVFGSDMLAQSGMIYGPATDANYKTRDTNAIGTLGKLGLWRLMEQTSAAVQIGRRSLVGILHGARFSVDAHPDADERVVEYARSAFLERMKTSINAVAAKMFNAVFYGIAPHEITLFQDGGLYYVADLAYRPPQTILLHTIQRGDDGWYQCEQNFYKPDGTLGRALYGSPGVAGRGWLLWPLFGDSGLPTGEGFYRPISAIYEDRVQGSRYRRIAVQKCALGTPVVQPRHDLKGSTGPTDEDIQTACEAVASIIVHEQGVIGMPSWAEKLDYVFGDPKSIGALTDLLRACDVDILMLFSAQYAARGTLTSYGTNAAGESDQAEQGGHRASMLQWLCDQFQPLIDWLVDTNFGAQKHYPSIKADFDKEISPADMIETMAKAVQNNLLLVDKGIRSSVRAKLDQEDEGDALADDTPEGSALLGMAGGVSAYIEIMNALRNKAIGRESAVAAIKAFYKLDDTMANDLIGKDEGTMAPVLDVLPSPALPYPGMGKDEGAAVGPGALEMCACGNAYAMAADAPQTRQRPRPGGQERRTGPNGRPLAALERLVNWGRIEMSFEQSESALRLALMDARREVVRYLADEVADGEWSDPVELAKIIQGTEIPRAMRSAIEERILGELKKISDTARETVEDEHRQQTGAAAAFSFSAGMDAYSNITASIEADEAIQDGRGQLVEIVKATFTQVAPPRSAMLDLLKRAANDLNEAEANAHATAISGEVFATARDAHVQEIVNKTKSEPTHVYYSAILDANTCSPCEFADAQYGEGTDGLKWGSAEMSEYMPPYQRCLGGARCRCVLIYAWE